jgi:alpha-L-fucosidase
MKKIISLLLLICVTCHVWAQTSAKLLPKDERMEWWREARFGMFIHWGVYAVPAGV